MKMENKAENCNLTLSAQLYGIEKQFQHPQDMFKSLRESRHKSKIFSKLQMDPKFPSRRELF